MVGTPAIITPRQLAVVKVPRFQKVMFLAWGSRAMYERKPVPAEQTAFTAMPASSSVKTFTLPNADDTRYTIAVAASAPRNAARGRAIAPSGVTRPAIVVP